MKKLFIVCLLLCALSLCFIGCTPTEQPTAVPTANNATPTPSTEAGGTLWKAGENYRILIWACTLEDEWPNREGNETLKQHWQDFMDETGVKITWVAAPAYDWCNDTMATANSGEPITDIFHMGGPYTIPGIVSYQGTSPGLYLVQLDQYDDFTDSEYWAVNTQEAVGTYKGKLYVAVPNETGLATVAVNHVTFFNSALIEKGGYNADQLYDLSENGEWTFEKLREVAIKCTDTDTDIFGLSVAQNAMTMLALISANGGDIVSNINGVPTFTAGNKESLAAINFFLSLCRDDKCVLTEGGASQDESSLFGNGKTAMMITYVNRADTRGPWRRMDFGIIQVPKGPDCDTYRSDRNWFSPYCVLKGGINDGGAVQILNAFIKPSCAKSSPENLQLMEAEASAFFKNERSLKTLRDLINYDNGTSYMVFWSASGDGSNLASLTAGNVIPWIEGERTPEVDFAASVDYLNDLMSALMGIK